jgi:hypothetical protein
MSDTAPPDTITGDLRQHIYRIYLNTAVDELTHRWVMNREWFRECRKLDGGHDGEGETDAAAPAYLLGLPVEVRDDGGPPHLER